MRVAIDGSFLALPPSGIGTYLRHLTVALGEIAPDLDVQVIVPDWDAPTPSIAAASLLNRIRRDRRFRRLTWDIAGGANQAAQCKPDLLHIPHFAAPFRSPIPFVVTIHDVIPLVLLAYRSSWAMRVNLAIMRRTVQGAQLILTPSAAAANDIAQVLAIPRQRIRVTPEAASEEYRPSTDLVADRAVARRFGVTERYIFNVGGFDQRKNLPGLLEAFAQVRHQLAEPVKLVIAGAPHSDNQTVFPPIAPIIDRLGLGDAVVLPGRISDADKLALYRGAALYATPSLYEGFGLTALEAMACGIPTIAANRSSLPEVVGDGGLLVEPDAPSFAAAMTEVLNDSQLAFRLRERGVARSADFSWQKTARLTRDAYDEVLNAIATTSRTREP